MAEARRARARPHGALDRAQDAFDRAHGALERAPAALEDVATALRPRLRGWLHAAAVPLAAAAGIVLAVLAPTGPARLAASVYAVTSVLLFAVSAVYHRGLWSDRTNEVLRRLDHANIYLIIAGTYTPFAMLALTGAARATILGILWGGAALGVAFRVLWSHAPRWLYTSLYVLIGWVGVAAAPQFLRGAGLAPIILAAAGGLLYTLGGVVYALRRPDPAPRWFGFHEVFHSLTLAAYITQYVGVSLVVYGTSA